MSGLPLKIHFLLDPSRIRYTVNGGKEEQYVLTQEIVSSIMAPMAECLKPDIEKIREALMQISVRKYGLRCDKETNTVTVNSRIREIDEDIKYGLNKITEWCRDFTLVLPVKLTYIGNNAFSLGESVVPALAVQPSEIVITGFNLKEIGSDVFRNMACKISVNVHSCRT